MPRPSRPENVHQRLIRLIEEAVRAGEYRSVTAFLREAKISSSFMRALELRVRANPDAKISLEYATRIARLLGVSAEYINDGAPTAATVDAVDRYPSRTKAVNAARCMDLPEAAIRLILAERSPEPDGRDPGKFYWWRRLEAEEARLRPASTGDR